LADDALKSEPPHRRLNLLGCSWQRVGSENARAIHDRRERSTALLERHLEEIPAVEMEQIEGVVHNRLGGLVMKGLEGRPPVLIERNDFAVKKHRVAVDLGDGPRHRGIQRGRILQIPRQQLDPCALLKRQRAITVPLDLIRPFGAVGKRGCGYREHWTHHRHTHLRRASRGSSFDRLGVCCKHHHAYQKQRSTARLVS
jgi:hypothetical protein